MHVYSLQGCVVKDVLLASDGVGVAFWHPCATLLFFFLLHFTLDLSAALPSRYLSMNYSRILVRTLLAGSVSQV